MSDRINVHLIDGTYELFRGYFGAPPAEVDGKPVGAARALIKSLAAWLRTGQVTHAGIAFDHVIESFRNQLFAGYKTGEGMDPLLYAQFPLAERAAAALGLVVWPMVEFEADDALATMAYMLKSNDIVEKILLTTPDKDLAQCVGGSVVTYDRHRDIVLDTSGVMAKFGVAPASIPDYLALVGDTADGIPGLTGWGAKSAGAVLARYAHLENIPDQAASWDIKVRSADKLATSLASDRPNALLYRQLATLRNDCPIKGTVADLRWHGVDPALLPKVCVELGISPDSIKLPQSSRL
jgi:5'-3' exonuclease